MKVTPPCHECGLPAVKLVAGRRKTKLQGYIRCVATACWNSATAIIGDVPLCPDHQRTVASELGLETPHLLRTTPNFVYYVTWPDADSIKIGTSQALRRRLTALARSMGKPRLLVVEPGGHSLERSRHRMFASLRKEGTELFRSAPVLLDHIENLRANIPHWRGMAGVGYDWD
jgi:hypothetical protein